MSNYMARHCLHYGEHGEFPFIKEICQSLRRKLCWKVISALAYSVKVVAIVIANVTRFMETDLNRTLEVTR